MALKTKDACLEISRLLTKTQKLNFLKVRVIRMNNHGVISSAAAKHGTHFSSLTSLMHIYNQ